MPKLTARQKAQPSKHDQPVGLQYLCDYPLVALIHIYGDPTIRIRDLSVLLGITERSVQRIVNDLDARGLVTVSRNGRRNHYAVNAHARVQMPHGGTVRIGDILACMQSGQPAPR